MELRLGQRRPRRRLLVSGYRADSSHAAKPATRTSTQASVTSRRRG
jgi:hypothetical protein